MPGLLSVVATPIGNLEDITLRGLRVLREAVLIAAEDTRHTAKLLRHHGIQTPTISFHTHNVRLRLPALVSRMAAGDHVALVSDAGTPGISDPGVELVAACRQRNVTVQAIPGASAPLAAAVVSGLPVMPLTILGFPPARGAARERWFEQASAIEHTFTFFEAPHRVLKTLVECTKYFGVRDVCVARELTKAYESSHVFVANNIKVGDIEVRGEFTLVVGPKTSLAGSPSTEPVSDGVIERTFLEASSLPGMKSRRDVIVYVAAELNVPRGLVYAALERSKAGRP